MQPNDAKSPSNGFDSLNVFLSVLFILFCIFGRFTPVYLFVAGILAVCVIFRARSKNLSRRQAENYRFIHLTGGVRDGYEDWRFKSRRRYFKCEQCGAKVAASPSFGEATLVCPNCGHHFTVQT